MTKLILYHRMIKNYGGVLKSMLASNIAIIDIKEYQINYFSNDY